MRPWLSRLLTSMLPLPAKEETKKAYKTLALEAHPAKNKATGSGQALTLHTAATRKVRDLSPQLDTPRLNSHLPA